MGILHERAKLGDPVALKQAFTTCPQTDSRDVNDNTPLHIASRHAREKAADFLLYSGFDPNAQNAAGETPLILSLVAWGLLRTQANNPAAGTASLTAAAAAREAEAIAHKLLKCGADPNLANDHGNTPMHYACLFRIPEAARRLVDAGALPNILNKYDISPWVLLRDDDAGIDAGKGVGGSGTAKEGPSAELRLFLKPLIAQSPDVIMRATVRSNQEAQAGAKSRFVASGGVPVECAPGLLRTTGVLGRTRRGVTRLGRYVDIDVVVKRPTSQELVAGLRECVDRARAAAGHANLLPIIAACYDPPHVQIATPRLVFDPATALSPLAGALADYLSDAAIEISPNEVVRILKGIANGMAHLHKMGVCHYALKSTNVLLGPGNHVQVSEFALPHPLLSSTVNTLLVNAPAYIAPEVLRDNRVSVGEPQKRNLLKADVFSFGIVAWEVVLRKRAYIDDVDDATGELRVPGAANPFVLGLRIVSEGIRPFIPAFVPDNLASLMSACWAESPEERPTFEYILDVLEGMVF